VVVLALAVMRHSACPPDLILRVADAEFSVWNLGWTSAAKAGTDEVAIQHTAKATIKNFLTIFTVCPPK
jgi:hypothetical protein